VLLSGRKGTRINDTESVVEFGVSFLFARQKLEIIRYVPYT